MTFYTHESYDAWLDQTDDGKAILSEYAEYLNDIDYGKAFSESSISSSASVGTPNDRATAKNEPAGPRRTAFL